MAKKKSKEEVREARSNRSQADAAEQAKRSAPARKARDIRNTHLKESIKADRERQIDLAADRDEQETKKASKPTVLDGKPGSGAGLKPGDWFAPKSNPGAAAQVLSQPLQPESLQSHGKGILYDKDIDNPPYDTGDPEETDEGPSGSQGHVVDKDAERKKAEKATPRFKQADPDNPAVGARGKKDATASPNAIGSRHSSKNAVAGGSNSGIDPD